MIKANEFTGEIAKELFEEYLIGKYTTEGKSIQEITQTIEDILAKFRMIPNYPHIVFNRALVSRNDNVDKLLYADFSVSLSKKNPLYLVPCTKKFSVANVGAEEEKFFDTFIYEMADFFDTYAYKAKLEENLNELNAEFADSLARIEAPFTIAFTLGTALVGASNDHALIGLTAETIERLSLLPLFDENNEERVEAYRALIDDTLKELNRPIEFVKLRTVVTADLKTFERAMLRKLLRNIVVRKIEVTRTGIGYVETPEVFAVIKRTALAPDELENLDLEGKIVEDNVNANRKEQTLGKTKILTEFLVNPFVRNTGEPLDMTLEEVLALVTVRK